MQNKYVALQIEDDTETKQFLPQELIHEICTFLKPNDLFIVSQTSIDWYEACEFLKWIQILPAWKMKRIPSDYTYEQRYEYAKKEALEFVEAKKLTKKSAKEAKSFIDNSEKFKKHRTTVAWCITCMITLLWCITSILKGFDIYTQWCFPIVWTMYVLYLLIPAYDKYYMYRRLGTRIDYMDVLMTLWGAAQILLVQYAAAGSISWFLVIIPAIVYVCVHTLLSTLSVYQPVIIGFLILLALFGDGYISSVTGLFAPLYITEAYYLLKKRNFSDYYSKSWDFYSVTLLVSLALFNVLYPLCYAWLGFVVLALPLYSYLETKARQNMWY
jgi:hypothetical protein